MKEIEIRRYFFYLIMGFATIGIVIISIWMIGDYYILLVGEKTIGIIISKELHHSEHVVQTISNFKYDVNNHQFISSTTHYTNFQVGDSIPIAYLSSKPEIVFVNYPLKEFGQYFFVIVGLIFVILGSYYLLLIKKISLEAFGGTST